MTDSREDHEGPRCGRCGELVGLMFGRWLHTVAGRGARWGGTLAELDRCVDGSALDPPHPPDEHPPAQAIPPRRPTTDPWAEALERNPR